MKNKRPSFVKAIAAWELLVAAGIVLFWASFFSAGPVGISDPRLEEVYLAFETAFPVADFVLVCVLVLGASGLLKGKGWGRTFTLIGGGMLVFLGLLDTSFNILQGIYRLGPSEAILNGAINLASLGSGIFLSFWAGSRGERDPETRRRDGHLPARGAHLEGSVHYSWERSRP